MASEGDRRSDPEVERRSRLLGGLHFEGEGARGVAIALVSTAVFVAILIAAVTQSPGWPEVKRTFFDWGDISNAFPDIARAFVLNVKIFLVCEVFILVFALLIAVLRSLRGPVFFPLRALAIVYCDVARGVPTILVILLLGLGAPALQLTGVPRSRVFWAGVALIFVYSGYVAEVYRAGIESVHPSQEAAARSLGLSRFQALRRVILPQAIRRVISSPPRKIRPASSGSSRFTQRSSVDLPEPEAPIKQTTSWSSSSRSIPRSTSVAPNDLRTPSR